MDARTFEILKGISEDKWRDHLKELVIYATARCERWRWRPGNKENLPNGFSPPSIASEAIKRLFSGERTWNHEEYPGDSPIEFLKSVIDSLISDLGRSLSHKTSASLEEECQRSGADGNGYNKDIQASDSTPGFRSPPPDSAYKTVYCSEIRDQIYAAVEDRPDLSRLFRLRCMGMKLKEIAEEIGKSREEIYRLNRLLERRLKEIKAEFLKEMGTINRTPEGGVRVAAPKHNG